MRRILGLLLWVVVMAGCDGHAAGYRLVTLVEGLDHPWGLAFLPDGQLLVTERPGRLWRIDAGYERHEVVGVPKVVAGGQGGLLDVALHPGFAANRWVYLSYAGGDEQGWGTEVARGRLEGDRLVGLEVIYRQQPKARTFHHYGSRLLFDGEGALYITQGDRGDGPRAQELGDLRGKVVRLRDDGTIPADNPFVGQAGARPEVYTLGNRNVQGAALHPLTGRVWTHEHGPQGGDEINILTPGANYGWPVITYGGEYGSGAPIGEGTAKEGMAQPLWYWVPSIAPSGMAFYTGDRLPQWRGNLFVGSLKFRLLVRLELEGDRVVREERMLEGAIGRIRDVRNGPDGYLYLLSDENPGQLARLEPD